MARRLHFAAEEHRGSARDEVTMSSVLSSHVLEGIRHDVPQEAADFAQAVIDLDGLSR